MVSWVYNNAKDVKTEINNTLRVSLAFALNRECKDAKNKNTPVGDRVV
jgi:hypothetical protein